MVLKKIDSGEDVFHILKEEEEDSHTSRGSVVDSKFPSTDDERGRDYRRGDAYSNTSSSRKTVELGGWQSPSTRKIKKAHSSFTLNGGRARRNSSSKEFPPLPGLQDKSNNLLLTEDEASSTAHTACKLPRLTTISPPLQTDVDSSVGVPATISTISSDVEIAKALLELSSPGSREAGNDILFKDEISKAASEFGVYHYTCL